MRRRRRALRPAGRRRRQRGRRPAVERHRRARPRRSSTHASRSTSAVSPRRSSTASRRCEERGGAIVVMASLNAWRAHPEPAGLHGIQARGARPPPHGGARRGPLRDPRQRARTRARSLTEALRERLERRAADGGLPVERGARRRRRGNSARPDGDGGGRRPRRPLPRQRPLLRDHRRAPARRRGHPLMLIHDE